jgi:hypothetical protein
MGTAPPETALLDAIADGELDDHPCALAAAIEARRRLRDTSGALSDSRKWCTFQFPLTRAISPAWTAL